MYVSSLCREVRFLCYISDDFLLSLFALIRYIFFLFLIALLLLFKKIKKLYNKISLAAYAYKQKYLHI